MATTTLQPNTEINGSVTSNQEVSLEMARSLSNVLADTYLLYLKTQNFHWNVQGNLFYGIHNLLEEQYKELALAVDDIAEQIRVLGLPAPGSFREFMGLSSLSEAKGSYDAEEMIAELAEDHLTLAAAATKLLQQAENDNDISSVEILSGRISFHEKQSWMLKSILR